VKGKGEKMLASCCGWLSWTRTKGFLNTNHKVIWFWLI